MLDLEFDKEQIKWLEKNVFLHFNMKSIDDLTEDNLSEVFDYIVNKYEIPLVLDGYTVATNEDLRILDSILSMIEDSIYY